MDGAIYETIVASINELNARHQGDGDSPWRVYATKEMNGYAVWSCHPDRLRVLVKYFSGYRDRSDAIEAPRPANFEEEGVVQRYEDFEQSKGCG